MSSATQPRRSLMLVSAAAAGTIALVIVLAGRGSDRQRVCRTTLIPAYASAHALAALGRASSRPRLIIVNPHNGPGPAPVAGYRAAVLSAQRAGARVLGYVPTGYGVRPAAAAAADISRYASWYGVDGVFLDEASSSAALVAYYRVLARRARTTTGRFVVLNPGVVPAREYFDIADVIVTYEGPYATYATAVRNTPRWLRAQPRDRVANLIYGASRKDSLAVARNRDGAGYLYVTSGSPPDPWRTVPSYLREQERALERCW